METLDLKINEKNYNLSVEGAPPFKYGKQELLSTSTTDITFNQDWYKDGYKAIPFLDETEFKLLKDGLKNCVKRLIISELNTPVDNFKLENYHHFVKSNEDHYKIVGRSRDLFPEDFNFPIMKMIPKFEKILNMDLTDINPVDGKKLHIIVRINRPGSNDYNPPHKDIYEGVDEEAYILQFINLWIPICGVTGKSSLPIVPKSHQLTEDKILRTFEGGVVEGNKYRVRMIKEWGGSNELERAKVNYGETLFFSSHLVHGLAINEEADKTRVSLEFRLFKQI